LTDVYREKIVLLGDGSVGKSSLIRRFVYSAFDEKYVSTLGTNISKKTLLLEGPQGPAELIMTLWDVVGQADFQSVQLAALKNAKGLLLVCDSTRRETFEHFSYWLRFTREACGPITTILIANKWDLEERKVSRADMEDMATRMGARFLLTSAKTGEGVNAAFTHLGGDILFARRPDVNWLTGTEQRETSPLLGLEDRIIATFCALAGDIEGSMMIVRQQFREAGIDFTRPRPEQMYEVVHRLVSAIEPFKGPDQASKVRQELLKIVRQALPAAAATPEKRTATAETW